MEQAIANVEQKMMAARINKEQIKAEIRSYGKEYRKHKERYNDALEARQLLQVVGQATQDKVSIEISDVVTTALQSIFPDPYEFVVKFELRRGQTECDFFFKRNGREADPLEEGGGGPADVAAFALRCAFWMLRPSRPVFLLDEPFKFVKYNLHGLCSDLIKSLSEKLGFQVIMTSHFSEIIKRADKIFEVSNGAVKEVTNV